MTLENERDLSAEAEAEAAQTEEAAEVEEAEIAAIEEIGEAEGDEELDIFGAAEASDEDGFTDFEIVEDADADDAADDEDDESEEDDADETDEDGDESDEDDIDPEEAAADAEEADADEAVTFADLGLSKDALTAVEKLGYENPTPVQEQAIPVVLEGRDLIAAASTGTGKTAAFLLPLLSQLPRAGRGKRPPRVLVVTPTRELAQQIAFTCIKVARATGHFATTVYGGTPYAPQIREIKGGTDVLIATPGRLCDLMSRGVVDLSYIEALVLDEADRMLDMGFLPDVTTIVEALPTERQTLLFSATIDQSIEKNLGSLLRDPVMVEIAHKGETAATVDQYIMPVPYKEKQALLEAVLREKGHERVIVFARTKSRCEECAQALIDAGFTAESIHSDKKQGQRRRALDSFRKGRTDILVATDVLARGIDVVGVDHVINLDLPDMPEDYIHRIGRTGRAGEMGYAISFVSANSRRVLRDIENLIGRDLPVMEMETYQLDRSILEKGKKGKKKDAKRKGGKEKPQKKYKGELDWQREKAREERAERRERETLERLGIIPTGGWRGKKNRDERRGERRDDRKGGYGRDDRRGGKDGEYGERKGGFGRGRDDRRSGRDGERKGFGRDERKGGFGRDDRRDNRKGYGRDERRGDKRDGFKGGDRKGGFNRDDRRGGYQGKGDRDFKRDDRRGGDRNERGGFKPRGYNDRNDRSRDTRGGRDDRRGGFRRDDRSERGGNRGGGYKGNRNGARGDFNPAERRIAENEKRRERTAAKEKRSLEKQRNAKPQSAGKNDIRSFGERKLREKYTRIK